MEHLDKLIPLSENSQGFIGICECCSNISLLYNNLALKLKEEEFDFFRTYLNNLDPSDFIYESRKGKNIFMRTPVENIVFCFSREETRELTTLMNEAAIMLATYKILK